MQDKNRDLFHLISTNTTVNEAAPDAEQALKEKEWLHLITEFYITESTHLGYIDLLAAIQQSLG